MANIAEIRQKYPQYSDLSDRQLADALHAKHYSDMPKADFDAKVGLASGAGPRVRGDIIEPGMRPVTPTVQPTRASGLPTRAYREFAGSRTGIDPENQRTAKRLSGVLYPAVDAAAAVTDVVGGGINAAIAGGAQTLGNLIGARPQTTEKAAGSLIELATLGQLFAGANPTAARVAVSRPARPAVTKPNPMRERVETFDRAKIDPSLAAVAASPGVSTTANVMGDLPYIGAPLKQQAKGQMAQAAARRDELKTQAGNARSPQGAGLRVQDRIDGFANDKPGAVNPSAASRPSRETSAATKGEALFARVGLDGTPVAPTRSAQAVTANVSAYADPELAAKFKNTNLAAIEKRLSSGEPLSFEDMRRLRRDVWNMGADPTNPALTADNTRLQSVYGALTEDLRDAAKAAGKEREFVQADKYWAASRQRINQGLKRFTGGTNESGQNTYDAIIAAAGTKSRGDLQALSGLRRSLPDEDWADVSATVIDRMGRTKDNEFSVSAFANAYNSMTPEARNILFSQKGRPGLSAAMEDLAAASEMLSKVEKLGNPSGSGRYANTVATVATTGSLSLAVSPWVLVTIPAARYGSSVMASPAFVRRMADAARIESKAKRGANVSADVDRWMNGMAILAAKGDIGAQQVLTAANDTMPARAHASEGQEPNEQERR